MFDLLTIGDCTWDTFLEIDNAELQYGQKTHRPTKLCLPYGEKIAIQSSFEAVGGNAANVAVGVKRLGWNVGIMSEIGSDVHGSLVKENLAKHKLNLSALKINKTRQTRSSVVINFKGERTLLSSFTKQSYTFTSLPDARYIYYTSLGFSFEKVQTKLIQYLKAHPQTQLICNPGTYQLKNGRKTFLRILPLTALLFVNKEEAEILVGKKASVSSLFPALLQTGAKTVVITDGVLGSHASNGHEVRTLGIYHAPLVSKTGAGDAYASGFVSAFIKDRPLQECMAQGTANAASVTEHLGAQTGLMNQKEMKKFLVSHTLS